MANMTALLSQMRGEYNTTKEIRCAARELVDILQQPMEETNVTFILDALLEATTSNSKVAFELPMCLLLEKAGWEAVAGFTSDFRLARQSGMQLLQWIVSCKHMDVTPAMLQPVRNALHDIRSVEQHMAVLMAIDGKDANRESAVVQLGNLSREESIWLRRAILGAGGIDALVELLQYGTAKSKASAALTLGNVAWHCCTEEVQHDGGGTLKWVPMMKQKGVIQLLAQCLRDKDEEVQEGTAGALWGLARVDEKTAKEIGEEHSVIHRLVGMLFDTRQSPNSLFKRNAAAAICMLARNKEQQMRIVEQGAIVPLLHLLQSSQWDDAKQHFAAALGRIAAGYSEAAKMIVQGGAVNSLLDMYKHAREVRAKDIAAKALLRTLQQPDNAGLDGVRCIDMSCCRSMESLTKSINQLDNLESLDLSSCSRLVDLPDSLRFLGRLHTLNLSSCRCLKNFPPGRWPALRSLDLSQCDSLQKVKLNDCEHLVDLKLSCQQLQHLELVACTALRDLPSAFGEDCPELRSLNLTGCSMLESIPDSIRYCEKLRSLVLQKCTSLYTVPASVLECKDLKLLDLRGEALAPERTRDLTSAAVHGIAGKTDVVLQCEMHQRPRILQGDSGMEALYNLPSSVLLLPEDFDKRQNAYAIMNQEDTLRSSMGAVSWVSIVFTSATFLIFLQPPGGLSDAGLVRVMSKGTAKTEGVDLNQAALITFVVFDIISFALGLTTTLYAVNQTMPRAKKKSVRESMRSLVTASVLLVVVISTGAVTFYSSAYAVYPKDLYWHIHWCVAVTGFVILVGLWHYMQVVWDLSRSVPDKAK